MLTGVFKDRSRDRGARQRASTEEQALAELLATRALRGFSVTRHCEIGPFVAEYLFPEHSLIVELAPSHPARRKFFNDMGYEVLTLEPRELKRHPRRALSRLHAALRS